MNTIEELERIKAAVLAECERVCPEMQVMVEVGLGLFIEQRSGLGGIGWSLRNAMGDVVYLAIFKYSPNYMFEAAYRLLGLEARDAVEAEREMLTKVPTQTYEEFKVNLARAVKDDDFPMADMYVQALMVQLVSDYTNLESRAAKLVEAVKKQINNLHWDDYAISVGESLERALAAHKKGGAQG